MNLIGVVFIPRELSESTGRERMSGGLRRDRGVIIDSVRLVYFRILNY